MKNKTFIIFLFLSLLLFIPSAYGSEPEKLLGISLDIDKKEITIKVVTTGCTQKKDFTFQMKDNMLTIIRNKKDFCKAMPEVISFTYSLKEAGIDQNKTFIIINKFIVNPNLATTL